MTTATVRIPVAKRDTLKTIARGENTTMKEVLSELIDEYVERHEETLDLLSRPEWFEAIACGEAEVVAGVPGKSLDELAEP